CGSLNFGDGSNIYVSTPDLLREGSTKIQTLGVRPELEIFDTGNLWFANVLVEEGLIDPPPLYQLCMGVPYGAPVDAGLLTAMVNMLPTGAQFTSFAIGRNQLPWVAQSVLAGGHARVGLEDNLYLAKGVKATNASLTERAVDIIEDLGAEVATPAEARDILDLRVQAPIVTGSDL
ncbi:MAG: 3-keto-5-aminohexanoate cleavage protein, partial [Brevibacterium sp.]|nr:3-keto-5-aminohexanoate cleavage protein [Brevibacterium sp.]